MTLYPKVINGVKAGMEVVNGDTMFPEMRRKEITDVCGQIWISTYHGTFFHGYTDYWGEYDGWEEDGYVWRRKETVK